MNNTELNEAAEKILDKITVGLHHPQFREAIITSMLEFAQWQLQQSTTAETTDEEIEQLAWETFIPAKNKTGDDYTLVPAQQHPNGWKKHLNSFRKGFKSALQLQIKDITN